MADHHELNIDTSSVPRGERDATRLVESIVAGDDRVERHFLEVKGPLDLSTKKDQAKIAKFILGAANRMPDKAATAFEGFAVMVIGVSGGEALGVPPIEVLAIEKAVAPYIGADGPNWDVVRVPVAGGNDVLLLLVDPPSLGQGPFVCLKSGEERLRDGAVFVRADGETREAKSDELRQLIRRGDSASAAVELEVKLMGAATRPKVGQGAVSEKHVSAVRARLLAAVPSTRNISLDELVEDAAVNATGRQSDTLKDLLSVAATDRVIKATDSFALAMRSVPEKRTRQEYIAQIEAWERAFAESWPEAVLRLAAFRLAPIEIRLHNREETFLQGVRLKVHLEGDVFGIACEPDSEELTASDLGLPPPPREWGPTPLLADLNPFSSHYLTGLDFLGTPTAPSRIDWQNSGSVDLTFAVGDLRPLETDEWCDGSPALLVPTSSDATLVNGVWEVTARGHNRVYRGELSIPVVDRDFSLDLREILEMAEPPPDTRPA